MSCERARHRGLSQSSRHTRVTLTLHACRAAHLEEMDNDIRLRGLWLGPVIAAIGTILASLTFPRTFPCTASALLLVRAIRQAGHSLQSHSITMSSLVVPHCRQSAALIGSGWRNECQRHAQQRHCHASTHAVQALPTARRRRAAQPPEPFRQSGVTVVLKCHQSSAARAVMRQEQNRVTHLLQVGSPVLSSLLVLTQHRLTE